MGLIADEQSAMAHMLNAAGNSRTWVALGWTGKGRLLEMHPAGLFSRWTA